ncbi:MAG TPA: dipeptidase [Bacteroidota bacterium]|nr:dipeptidase [Bacteroidota bacterium]
MNSIRSYLALLCAVSLSLGARGDADYRKIHFDALVVDTHNDVAQRILGGEDISSRTGHGHSDLPRLAEGGVDLQLFSIWVPPEKTSRGYFDQAVEQLDSIEGLARRNPGRLALAPDAAGVDSIVAAGKIAGMFGLEGGHHIGDDISKLDYFYGRGVRYMTLTWNNSTGWATSASDETDPEKKLPHRGLTDSGRAIVRKMNDIGMLVDVSHVGEQTFRDVMETTRKPVIASHSSVWTIAPHRRNLRDWQLRALKENGGVVFINFAPWFIDSTFGRKEDVMRRRNKARIDSIQSRIAGDEFLKDFYSAEQLTAEYDTIRPTLKQVLDHFEYVIRLIGADHVGIGSDFDGITVAPAGLEDVTRFPELTKGLLERGYSEGDVRKILGGNFMRVLRAAEKK